MTMWRKIAFTNLEPVADEAYSLAHITTHLLGRDTWRQRYAQIEISRSIAVSLKTE